MSDERGWWSWAVRLAVTVVVVGIIANRIDLLASVHHFSSAPWWAFAVPIVLMLLNAVVHGVRLQLLLFAAGVAVPLWPVIGVVLRAIFVGVALPTGGGEVARIAYLSRLTGRADAAVAAAVVGRLLEFLPWSALLGFGLLWGIGEADPLLGAVTAFFAIAFLCAVAIAVFGANAGPAAARRLPGRIGAFAERCAQALLLVRRHPRCLIGALVWGCCFGPINVLSVWVVLQAYGVEMAYRDALAVFPATDTVISLPISMNGVGVREGMYARVLSQYGVDEALAVAVGLTRWVGELGRAAVGGVLFLRAAPQAPADATNGRS